MIVYDLACSCGYQFEGWFKNREDMDAQLKSFLVSCPSCGGHEVRKILSPISIQVVNGPSVKKQLKSSLGEHKQELSDKEILSTLQHFVEDNFEDVGTDLASESLKIHYGVKEPRNIRGVTTMAEEETLKEEGVNLLKIPMPVKDDPVN